MKESTTWKRFVSTWKARSYTCQTKLKLYPKIHFNSKFRGTEASLPSNGQFNLPSFIRTLSLNQTIWPINDILICFNFFKFQFCPLFFQKLSIDEREPQYPMVQTSKVNLIVHINIQSVCNHSLDRAKAAFNCTGKSN